MNTNELVEKFIESLIQETITGMRKWKHLPRKQSGANNNQIIYETAFFEDEWHRILYEDSFELHFETGFFFLVHERSESGRDGTVFDEYNLYIQSDVGTEPIMVANDTPEVYRLRNAIGNIKKDTLPDNIINMMNTFLTV